MSLARIVSRAAVGVSAPEVFVEVHLAGGLPAFSIVGLPEASVREARDRVRAALQNSGFDVPQRRITISLAPADLPKAGGRFDLAMALGILAASRQIPSERLEGTEFVGELSLGGELRAVPGLLPAALQASRAGRRLVVPAASSGEAALVVEAEVCAADHLLAVSAWLRGGEPLPRAEPPEAVTPDSLPDLVDVIGQPLARRALEIAAAGGHNLLLIGPPGTGKTMLAERLPGILPPLDEAAALASAAVRSVSTAGFDPARWRLRPFRAPHHSASLAALVGGGGVPRPGEVSLAHHGVLFLDELPEFEHRALEALREPLESGTILISRAARQAEFPACFQLVAAMNPCPCGRLGDPVHACRCSGEQVQRYRSRVSGPLLDRIDLQVEVPRPKEPLVGRRGAKPEASHAVRERVARALALQHERQGRVNARLSGAAAERLAGLDTPGEELLNLAAERLGLSPRAVHRSLRVARTIADLDHAETVSARHLAEAVALRRAAASDEAPMLRDEPSRARG